MGSGEIGVGSTREKQRMGAWRVTAASRRAASRSDGHAPVVVTQAVLLRRRQIRRPALRFALLLCLALAASGAASSTAQASKACKFQQLDSGSLYNIVATGTGCTTARNVAVLYNACINNGGSRVKPCNRKIERFTCSAKRRRTATKQLGQVTCRLARKTVRFSYWKALVE